MDARKLQKLINFAKNYGAGPDVLRKLMNEIIHVTVYSHERGYTHNLCSDEFFALDLTPRANDRSHVLYTSSRRPTDQRTSLKRRATIITHFLEQLNDGVRSANCDRCVLLANVVIANKCDIAYAHGMRHLKNLLETP